MLLVKTFVQCSASKCPLVFLAVFIIFRNMKSLLLLLLCFPLAIGRGKGFKVLEVAELAYEVITRSIQFIDQLNSGEDSDTVEWSIKNLQSRVDYFSIYPHGRY